MNLSLERLQLMTCQMSGGMCNVYKVASCFSIGWLPTHAAASCFMSVFMLLIVSGSQGASMAE